MTTLWRAEECGKSKLTLHLVTHPSLSLNDLFCLLFLSLVFLVFLYMLSPTRMPFIPLIFFLIYSPITLLLLHLFSCDNVLPPLHPLSSSIFVVPGVYFSIALSFLYCFFYVIFPVLFLLFLLFFHFVFPPLVFNLFFKPFVHFSIFSFSSLLPLFLPLFFYWIPPLFSTCSYLLSSLLPHHSFLTHYYFFYLFILFCIQLSSYTLWSLPSHLCFSFFYLLS